LNVENQIGTATSVRAFFLLLGIPGAACSGVSIAENAHRCTSPAIYTYRKNALRLHPAARVLLSGIPAAIDEMTVNKPDV